MRLEPKPAPGLAVTLLFPVGAIVATVLIASLLVLIAGASPFNVFWLVVKGAAGSQFALLETLVSNRDVHGATIMHFLHKRG